jgi:hypothetical protein
MEEELLPQLLAVASVDVSPETVSLSNGLVERANITSIDHNSRCRRDNNRCDNNDTSVDDCRGTWRCRVCS